MRPLWKGSISFGLISIPISLFPATRREEMRFRLLRSGDLSPVNYKRVAEADGKEVPWEQIVKGYEYEKGRFVVLKDDDFKRVDVEATQTVDILDFVNLDEINPMHFQKPYFMEPSKAGSKAYVLLRDALGSTRKVGIAKVVIRKRQHLAAVKPQGEALILEIMHFADELVSPAELHLPSAAGLRKGETEMAQALIDKMTVAWEPERYSDDYESALRDLIAKKVAAGGKDLPTQPKSRGKEPENVIDLMEVLRKSLDDASRKPKARKARSAPKSRKAA